MNRLLLVALVRALHIDDQHRFSKRAVGEVYMIAGVGIDGDAHAGPTVRHRSRVAMDPSQPNLRQVHLLHEELFAEVTAAGFSVAPGELGENVTTSGVELLTLPVGATIRLGNGALLAVTGRRNPCGQVDGLKEGLLRQLAYRDAAGAMMYRGGLMAVVVQSGVVRVGDPVTVAHPPPPHAPVERV